MDLEIFVPSNAGLRFKPLPYEVVRKDQPYRTLSNGLSLRYYSAHAFGFFASCTEYSQYSSIDVVASAHEEAGGNLLGHKHGRYEDSDHLEQDLSVIITDDIEGLSH